MFRAEFVVIVRPLGTVSGESCPAFCLEEMVGLYEIFRCLRFGNNTQVIVCYIVTERISGISFFVPRTLCFERCKVALISHGILFWCF